MNKITIEQLEKALEMIYQTNVSEKDKETLLGYLNDSEVGNLGNCVCDFFEIERRGNRQRINDYFRSLND